jgi:hypothetical protein
MVVWRGEMSWIGRVLQQFKVEISQLLLWWWQPCVKGIVQEKQRSFLQLPLPFGDQCLLCFVQKRHVVVCCDCCTLLEVVKQQYPILVPRNKCHQLGDWLLCWTFFGWGEPLCLHSLDWSLSLDHTNISKFHPLSHVQPRNLLCSI